MDDYKKKIEREQQWYTQPTFQNKHFLNSKLLYSEARNMYNHNYVRRQLALFIKKTMDNNRYNQPKILIAPIGTGNDVQYIQNLSNDISGIDISAEAMARIENKNIKLFVGDIKKMHMFSDNIFDIVVVSLFFHHFLQFGFEPFIKETYRVLKPGGYFFTRTKFIISNNLGNLGS